MRCGLTPIRRWAASPHFKGRVGFPTCQSVQFKTDFPSVLAAASHGADWALEAIYRGMNPGLMCYLRAKEPNEADDLATDIWITVTRHLAEFNCDESGFRAWTFRIAKRRVADHRRKRDRRRTDPLPPEPLAGCSGDDDPAASVIDALDAQGMVIRWVRVLSPAQAEVLLLRVVCGLRVDEVATTVGRSQGAVRVLQHRALKRLGEILAAEGGVR